MRSDKSKIAGRITSRLWQKNHPEKRKEYNRRYYEGHLEKERKRHREYSSQNRNTIRAWNESNREKVRLYGSRSARKRCAEISDVYVKRQMRDKMGIYEPSQKLIDLKRKQLLLSRELRKLKEAANG